MLELSRKKYEKIVINNNLVVTILDIQKNHVVIGFKGDKFVKIIRKELYNNKEKTTNC
jgi:carbon storage regulator CsrA